MNLKSLQKQFIFEEDRPFASCHASTVIALPGGDLLSAWFGGTREGAADVAIWCSHRIGGAWTPPVKVADEDGVVHWNPVLHRRGDGRIFLYYKVGHPIPRWYTRVIESADGGRTWSEPAEPVPGDVGGRGPVKNKLIVAADGAWLAPASLEGDSWEAFVDISRDEGASWTASEPVPRYKRGYNGKGLIQPSLWESQPGRIHMLIRSTECAIYRSDSADGGRTWCQAYRTALPNNNSGLDLVKLRDGAGTLALVYNPVAEKGTRSPLSLAVSGDNGATWRDVAVLENEPGEYSYPAIIEDGKTLIVTYTWRRERIVCWTIEVE